MAENTESTAAKATAKAAAKATRTRKAAKRPAAKTAVPAEPAVPEFTDVPGVLIAAVEAAPLVKVGGLADVVGALPKYLKGLGVDARVIMPYHRQIAERYAGRVQHLAEFNTQLGWRSQYVGVKKLELDGTVFYFIDNSFYFGGPVYCGGDLENEQYAFFARAVLDSIPLLDFDVRILHCNDWHTAAIPMLAKSQYQGGMQAGLRTVLTIHNLHFQGWLSYEAAADLLSIDKGMMGYELIGTGECVDLLKAGILYADKVTTVSPTYASEICGHELGEGLEATLRMRGDDLWGILNGIDTDVWDPAADPAIPARYSSSRLANKAKVKRALIEELGLDPIGRGKSVPVIGMVGRLTPQKGIDLLEPVLEELMEEDIRLVVLGTGDEDYEEFLKEAAESYEGKMCALIGFDAELSHRIYAGSDLFLMPSQFEPCGISQMIAMRYGTLPIVRETGGLRDTVIPYNEETGEGTGFSFANYDAEEMLEMVKYAVSAWRHKSVRDKLVHQAMKADFSFERCARTYALLYRELA